MIVHQRSIHHYLQRRMLLLPLKRLRRVPPLTFSTPPLFNSSGRLSSNWPASPSPKANNSPSLTTTQCSVQHLVLSAVFHGRTNVSSDHSPTAMRWPVMLVFFAIEMNMSAHSLRSVVCLSEALSLRFLICSGVYKSPCHSVSILCTLLQLS